MQQLKPVSPRMHSRPEQIIQHLASCAFVFIRIDATCRPLTPPYEGSFRVLKRADKFFTVDKHGKPKTMSIDRFKTAFVDSSTDTSVGNTPLLTTRDQTQVSNSAQHHQSTAPAASQSSTAPSTKPYATRSGRIITKPKRFVHFAD
ncbi:Gag-Pol polyprotein [Schistosoma japonicum]|uniref:Gag-Pol polyprotein n=1 Tax=Schistosoma japonicum TaxID=6182 RepID=A0A4Z2CXA9_SCHJA|nr:Gag-Pol polyprotein [Schistosoma japonicum]